MTEDEMRQMFGNADPFSDFFHTFFGGSMGSADENEPRSRRATRQRVARQGRDVEQEIALDLEDAYRGTTKRLSIKHDGHARTVDVRIPGGVGDGSRVRVAGEGELGGGGAPSGDLYLRIKLLPHARFERKGRDLFTKVSVGLTTAVLGGEADAHTLDGKTLRVKIPAGTQNGQVFRLRGHGMPVVGKQGESGDLYATVDVELPRALTTEQREHFEALQKLENAKHSAA
jgi:DnaJ-class molecular chaperone